jgi:hypothetical protein
MVAKFQKFVIIIFVVARMASCAGIAQSVEHFTRNEGVVGSSPISSFLLKVLYALY